jgi:exopolysaccharide biosynthesis polyprenyl glycosylphosphotransferase
MLLAAVSTGVTLVVFLVSGLYRGRRGVSRMDEFYRLTTRISLSLIVGVAVTSFLLGSGFVYSRRVLVLSWFLAIVLVTAGRFLHAGLVGDLRAHGLATDRLLIVGAGETGRIVLDKVVHSPQLGYEVAGFVRHRPWTADTPPEIELAGYPILGNTPELAAIVRARQIDEIIIALPGVVHEEVLDIVLRVVDLPVAIRVYPDTFRLITSDVLNIDDLNGLPTVSVRSIGLRPVQRAVKRGMDIVISASVLILLSPVILLFAVLVKLTSPGPVFYVQERVGRDGRPFQALKFRSMPVDAELQSGPVFATSDDQRPTRFGRFMRRYSIDELPQFVNVLVGEMSVVGPRPERPFFVEQFKQTIPAYMARHYEKSGITGWAQVNGLRGDTSVEERTQYDLYYVENWSIFFDLRIMVKTLLHIFRRDNNAY